MKQDEPTQKLRRAFEDFLNEVDQLKKEHRGKIQEILNEINEMKIKELREKLKTL